MKCPNEPEGIVECYSPLCVDVCMELGPMGNAARSAGNPGSRKAGVTAGETAHTERVKALRGKYRESLSGADDDARKLRAYPVLLHFAQSAAMYGEGAALQRMAVEVLQGIGEPWHW